MSSSCPLYSFAKMKKLAKKEGDGGPSTPTDGGGGGMVAAAAGGDADRLASVGTATPVRALALTEPHHNGHLVVLESERPDGSRLAVQATIETALRGAAVEFAHDVDASPTDPDELIAVGIDVWSSSDGGATWDKVLYIDDETGVNDLVLHPTDPETIYATTWQRTRVKW